MFSSRLLDTIASGKNIGTVDNGIAYQTGADNRITRTDVLRDTMTPIKGRMAPDTYLRFHENGFEFVENGTSVCMIRDDSDAPVEIIKGERLEQSHVAIQGVTFLTTRDDLGTYVWMTDGTPKGTRQLTQVPKEGFGYLDKIVAYLNGRVYFTFSRYEEEVLASVSPADSKLRYDFVPNYHVYGAGHFQSINRLGGNLVAEYSGTLARSFQLIDSAGATPLKLGKLRNVKILTDNYDNRLSAGADSGTTAGDVLLVAREGHAPSEIYAIDAHSRKVRRLSNLPAGFIDPLASNRYQPEAMRLDVIGGDHILDGDRRWLVTIDRRPVSSNGTDEIANDTGFPLVTTYMADPHAGTFVPLIDQHATTVVATREGTFASMVDGSLWTIPTYTQVEAYPREAYPVAIGARETTVAQGRVLLHDAWNGKFRTLNDTKTIVFGTAFNDVDGDRVRDPDEPATASQWVYVDSNHDARRTHKEPAMKPEDASSYYYFDGLGAGSYDVRVQATGWHASPHGALVLQVNVGGGEKSTRRRHSSSFALQQD